MRFDAIIAGADHNGLTVACFMARAGLKTAMVEQEDHVGGAAVSLSLMPG